MGRRGYESQKKKRGGQFAEIFLKSKATACLFVFAHGPLMYEHLHVVHPQMWHSKAFILSLN